MSNVNESSGASVTQPDSSFKRKSNDVGWEYGMLIDGEMSLDKILCKLCGKQMSGGIYRLKEHIAHIPGNVSKCLKSTPDDQLKCKNAILEAKSKKKNKKKEEYLMREEVNIDRKEDEEEELGIGLGGVRKRSHPLGPIDRFTNIINPESSMSTSKAIRQQNINEALFKERTHQVHRYVARWVYRSGVSFNSINNDDFKLMLEAVGQFGPGYRPPSLYQLREPLLKEEMESTKQLLEKQKEEWVRHGCSIMTDAWSDKKRRSIMNLCVNCREGTTFLSSKECFGESHTAELIFDYVKKCIKDVGPENVVQVVTDNASNNMAAAKLLKKEWPTIFWTSCATHTINLMLESISKIPRYQKVIEQAKQLTIFIYAHHKTLAMMRFYTKKRDIVRPGVTRFASSFLSLQSLLEKKNALKMMFTSEEWDKCKFSKVAKGKLAYSTVMSLGFWNGVTSCLKVFAPLVRVLRLVDGDQKPAMGWLYGELRKVKEEIRVALNDVENNYRSIFNIIEEKMKDRLDSPLHLTGFLLNPYFLFKDEKIGHEQVVLDALYSCADAIFPGQVDTQDDIFNCDLVSYKNKEGPLGRPMAIRALDRSDYDPVEWWKLYGNQIPNLQRIATRILALTTSSSGCERNWSTFEGIHTKKRNRLDATRLNNLVYVQFNAKLMDKKKKAKESNVDVLLASDGDPIATQGWIVKGGDDDDVELDIGQSRELHDDEFASENEEEEEEEEEEDIVFEFDEENEQVMEDVYREEDC